MLEGASSAVQCIYEITITFTAFNIHSTIHIHIHIDNIIKYTKEIVPLNKLFYLNTLISEIEEKKKLLALQSVFKLFFSHSQITLKCRVCSYYMPRSVEFIFSHIFYVTLYFVFCVCFKQFYHFEARLFCTIISIHFSSIKYTISSILYNYNVIVMFTL